MLTKKGGGRNDSQHTAKDVGRNQKHFRKLHREYHDGRLRQAAECKGGRHTDT